MINHVYKPKRIRGGKRIVNRLYRAKYRIDGEAKIHDVPLGVCDKQVAEQKLAAIVRDCEKEKCGLIPSHSVRDNLQKPLTEHLCDYVADLQAQGRNSRHIRQVQNAVLQVAEDCEWKSVQNVTADSFQGWRACHKKAAKTLNEYLGACAALLTWMVRNGRSAVNPLVTVRKVETRGRETRIRYVYTDAEMERLLAVAGPQRVVILTAVLTGIRHGELKGMRWGDFGFVSDNPTFTVRAAISKNHGKATLPLHPNVVIEVAKLKPDGATDGDLVFKGLVPRSKLFNALLKAAEIPKHDTQGHVADFHSLRHTFCTYLQRAGVSQREVMELMRHNDPRLTASTYTDPKMLGLRSAVGKLSIGDSQLDSQELVASGHSGSSPVTNGGVQTLSQPVESKADKSLPVILGHDLSQPGVWCALQGLNLRPLPCEGNALPLS
jgi:integrase/recombinase XerC